MRLPCWTTAAGVPRVYDAAMLTWSIWLCWLVLAYLLGSVSFALILGRVNGINIRAHGSGNVGATNLGRALGKKWGLLCFFLDLAKGLVPVVGYRVTLGGLGGDVQGAIAMLYWLSIGVAAVVGHMFPVYLKFKGGKGVATSAGALLGFWPVLTVPVLASGVVWLVVTRATAYVGLASVVAAASLPVFAVVFGLVNGEAPGVIGVCGGAGALLALLVIIRHTSNLKRLMAGTEEKIGWAQGKKAKAAGRATGEAADNA